MMWLILWPLRILLLLVLPPLGLAHVQWASAEEDRVHPGDGRTADRRVAGARSQAHTATAVWWIRISQSEKVRIYHYYVPVYLWCNRELETHTSKFKLGEPVPALVVINTSSCSLLFINVSEAWFVMVTIGCVPWTPWHQLVEIDFGTVLGKRQPGFTID